MPANRFPHSRRGAAALALVVLLGTGAGCTLGEIATPRPRPSATPSPTPSPSPTAVPATPTPVPTPNLGAIPDLVAGEIVASRIDGLRVRQRPGVEAPITTGLLPLDAQLQVVMGPFIDDELGWYLVTDADPDEPHFAEGWVAAGFEPDAFLGATGRVPDADPFVLGMAGRGDAEEGPIEIGDGDHAVRWIAADPEREACRFAVSLTPAGGEAVATIRATVGAGLDRGTLQPQTFASLGVRGPAFVGVTSDCQWALVILRVPDPRSTPVPSATAQAG
jgi:hypothetical protein